MGLPSTPPIRFQEATGGKSAVPQTVTVPTGSITGNTVSLVTSSGNPADNPTLAAALAAKADKTLAINAQTGTTYTLQATDNGLVVTLNNASSVTVTVPTGLGAGLNCLMVQLGVGLVTLSASGTTINHRQSHTGSAGRYAEMSLIAYASNTFVLGGDTA